MSHRAIDFVDDWIAANILEEPAQSPQRVQESYAALIQAAEGAGIPEAELNDTFQVPGALRGWLSDEIVSASNGTSGDRVRIVEQEKGQIFLPPPRFAS